MKLNEIQTKVAHFVADHQIETDLKSRMLDMVSEIGELSKEILKSTDYGKKSFTPDADWENELGDTLFSLICIANQTDVNLSSALDKTLEKYQNRFGKKGDMGSGN